MLADHLDGGLHDLWLADFRYWFDHSLLLLVSAEGRSGLALPCPTRLPDFSGQYAAIAMRHNHA
jgi:hypothetical protein